MPRDLIGTVAVGFLLLTPELAARVLLVKSLVKQDMRSPMFHSLSTYTAEILVGFTRDGKTSHNVRPCAHPVVNMEGNALPLESVAVLMITVDHTVSIR